MGVPKEVSDLIGARRSGMTIVVHPEDLADIRQAGKFASASVIESKNVTKGIFYQVTLTGQVRRHGVIRPGPAGRRQAPRLQPEPQQEIVDAATEQAEEARSGNGGKRGGRRRKDDTASDNV